MRYHELPRVDHPLVSLRPLRGDDLTPWYRILSEPRVFEHTSWNLAGAADLRPYLEDPRAPDSRVRWALALRSDDRLIGSAGFHTVSAPNRTAEIAYDLAPEVWGHGIASAAVRALVGWAFAHVGLLRVQATTLHSNLRSQRVLEACAFEREGLLRRYRLVRDVPGDFWMFARLA